MEWATDAGANTPENQELQVRRFMVKFLLREELNLLGMERTTGQPVVWCGFHSINWKSRWCDIGYWVRKSAQNRGFATEATNALLRYAFHVLGMQRVGIAHAGGNHGSRRVIEKLGFQPEGVQKAAAFSSADLSPDRHLFARFSVDELPPLEVSWLWPPEGDTEALGTHLRGLEEQLLDPAVRSTPAAVGSLLTAGFREFGSSGRVFSREQVLSALQSETSAALSLQDFRCDRLGPTTALVTYRSVRNASDGTTTSALRSSVWLQEDGCWRMHFHQGTRE